jgi:ribosomal protein L11 methyltransferase
VPRWLSGREEFLQARFGDSLAIISQPEHKRVRLEVACRSKAEAQEIVRDFGGRVTRLGRNWLERFAREQKSKPLKIGKRLVISRKGDLQIAPAVQKQPVLVIPATTAFGTGEHPTTAMSLRVLEELTRGWKLGWSIVDLGTGTGILALAAKRLGACHVLGIDNDPMAISTAKNNARSNKLGGISFQLCDAHSWKPPGRIDILIANLFSELVIELLPKFQCAQWLILSGILRAQEQQIVHALQQYRIDLVKIRRRGKWIAILARNSRPAARTGS